MDWSPISIAFGAVLGALSRYYITLWWIQKRGNRFPYGTLFVNLTGAFLMGLLVFLMPQLRILNAVQPLVMVGFLGSYTTFSSYILETTNLLRNRRPLTALLYWLGSLTLGLIGVEMGMLLAKCLTIVFS